MNEEIEIYEIVKEYTLYIDNLDYKIHGRVTKKSATTGHMDYKWEVSHYYVPAESAMDVYTPGNVLTNTFEESERLLLLYFQYFKTIGILPNKYY